MVWIPTYTSIGYIMAHDVTYHKPSINGRVNRREIILLQENHRRRGPERNVWAATKVFDLVLRTCSVQANAGSCHIPESRVQFPTCHELECALGVEAYRQM